MKALIYTRVSTTEQGESGLGLDGQLAKCQAYAERIDAEVVARIVSARINGSTWQSIADGLNADGVATGRGGSCWRDSSVRAVWRSSEGGKAIDSALAIVARHVESVAS